eukprot:gnl/MRDRNA2_/MRDRNA2_95886_c0_seq1.p1 gnl/MRDRNA2_/MRDRNA2_95886_c0~~gnl/MRDRNA2_/MRDRNA2_95886_c0_seq1.p1  ORF type:complete len:304 (-),score=57.59 gnl/MRDRNA2_/MRDRNA2_95886_c0_seq1:104-1015(-)
MKIVRINAFLFLSIGCAALRLSKFSKSEDHLLSSEDASFKTAKVAVLFSGALRTLDACKSSFIDYVIQANPKLSFDTYAFFSVDSESEVRSAEKLVQDSLPNLKKVKIEDDNFITKQVIEMFPGIHNVPAGNTTQRGKAINVAKQLRGFKEVASMVNFDSYDLIVRIRPDLCFCQPLDLMQTLEEQAVYLPWHKLEGGAKSDLAFDQFAVGSPDAMRIYTRAHESMKVHVSALEEIYPENVLGKHLQANKVSVRHLEGFSASLARGQPDGKVTMVDPFANLRKDFSSLKMPDWTCKPDTKMGR